ncbi:hypothetical protein FGO68_gene8339 [Halteria grandinella]|uniref:Uncharacterized protein n=1 Tax=Halteria grandinella TaxID=5974 RepID=A0A8J8N8V6_HALGN|nr:hypothetical protein FGO68_gene8339 [Halteria grandinella]
MEEESPLLESPSWLAPVMVANFLIGLFWIVVFYVSQTQYPVPGIGAWNMIIGFTFIGVGFSLATKWRQLPLFKGHSQHSPSLREHSLIHEQTKFRPAHPRCR